MSIKDLRLDVEATFMQAISGRGYAHYGYWPDAHADTLSLERLAAAQHAYLDLLAAQIPDGTRTILDVGSGTGANARELVERGYDLACLCPSPYLNDLARAKLPDSVDVADAFFEDYASDRRFDLCLFAESFHYIQLDAALRQLDRFAEHGVLIFDYFRRPGHDGSDGTRGTHAAFLDAVSAQGVFRVVTDDDLTANIQPTFAVLDHIRGNLAAPCVSRARDIFAREYPLRSRLVNRFFGKRLDRLAAPGTRAETFGQRFEYRLIRMERITA